MNNGFSGRLMKSWFGLHNGNAGERQTFAAIALLVTMLCSPLAAQIPITGKPVKELKPFDDLLASFMAQHEVVGASVAVAKDGRIIYSRGFGFADREAKTPVDPDALFRIASISKPITSVAIFQLIEQGKLKLSDRVVEVLKLEVPAAPKGDPRWREITIQQLLQHTAGHDRGKSFDAMFKAREFAIEQGVPPPAGPREVITSMLSRPLDFTPGERYAYSNLGYNLLGRVIEKVSGQEYEAYVKEHVLKPAGVTTMRIGATRTTAKGEVKYHDRGRKMSDNVFAGRPGEPAKVPDPYGGWYLEAMDAHGGWIASAPDLLRFARIADGQPIAASEGATPVQLLTAESIRAMFARPVYTDPEAAAKATADPAGPFYACGWGVRVVREGRLNTWHNGGLWGTSTLLVRRHDGLSWAVLFNSDFTGDRKWLAATIDPLMHEAAGKVEKWP